MMLKFYNNVEKKQIYCEIIMTLRTNRNKYD